MPDNIFAIQLNSLPTEKCDQCESIVFADDYYNCVLANCKNKMIDKIKLLPSSDHFLDNCQKCKAFNDDFLNLCVFYYCRKEIPYNSKFLLKKSIFGSKTLKNPEILNEYCKACKMQTGEILKNCKIIYCEKTDLKLLEENEAVINTPDISAVVFGVVIFFIFLLLAILSKIKNSRNTRNPVEDYESSRSSYKTLV